MRELWERPMKNICELPQRMGALSSLKTRISGAWRLRDIDTPESFTRPKAVRQVGCSPA